MAEMEIDGRKIGKDYPPYIIAEMSANHNGSLERALKIIKMAKEAGADAVKLQTYRADTMTLNVDHPRFRVQGDNPWDGDHLYDLYERAATPWDWHQELFDYAEKIGITVFSSPFDSDAIDLLESLHVPAYKIASFELVDHELIRRCAETGKPLIMSTGMATITEIAEAVEVARAAGVNNLALLKCTSAYPAPFDTINLKTMPNLSETFSVLSGLSDHSMGTAIPVAATALGATIIEKHVTLSRADGGVDSTFSLEPHELKQLVDDTRNAHSALGCITYVKSDLETSFKKYRRSLFFIKDLPAGHVLGEDDIAALRPGDGLMPKYKNAVLGRSLGTAVTRGMPVSWETLA